MDDTIYRMRQAASTIEGCITSMKYMIEDMMVYAGIEEISEIYCGHCGCVLQGEPRKCPSNCEPVDEKDIPFDDWS